MNKNSIDKINKLQKYIDTLNKKVKNSPFCFSWAPPTNHTSGNELDYFCVYLHASLVQESEFEVERNMPITLLYYFGQVKNLKDRVQVESIESLNDWFHLCLGRILTSYTLALSRIASGFKNPNFKISKD